MDKFTTYSKSLFSFIGELGYPVYLTNQVPKNAVMPYITFDYTIDIIGETNLISGKIWDNSTSRTKVNEISDKLFDLVGYGKKIKVGDYGNMIVRKGSPFIQALSDDYPTNQVNYFNLEIQLFI